MIVNLEVKQSIITQWIALKALCRHGRSSYLPDFGQIIETTPERYFNLPFVLAYSVLDQVLLELVEQGVIKFKAAKRIPGLGQMMFASNGPLKWLNYEVVAEGKTARNDLAHRATLIPTKAECFRFILAIERELLGWDVIPASVASELA